MIATGFGAVPDDLWPPRQPVGPVTLPPLTEYRGVSVVSDVDPFKVGFLNEGLFPDEATFDHSVGNAIRMRFDEPLRQERSTDPSSWSYAKVWGCPRHGQGGFRRLGVPGRRGSPRHPRPGDHRQLHGRRFEFRGRPDPHRELPGHHPLAGPVRVPLSGGLALL